MSQWARKVLESLLESANVQIGGSKPWDIRIQDNRFFRRVLGQGSLGLGESYMDGWWECERPDELIFRVLQAGLDSRVSSGARAGVQLLAASFLNLQSRARAFVVGERHYDISTDLYRKMLDERMSYSCGYWQQATTLDEAQEHKLDLICRKLDIQPGQRVLDIGCGWGSFSGFAAERYGAEVVGVTISREQAEFAKQRYGHLPVDIRLQDYRSLNEPFDRIVSIGMFEHVGYKNYRTYMEVARRCLHDDGLFLLHTIGNRRTVVHGDPWMHRYIFPNGMLPSIKQVGIAIENRFIMEDWHNFGADYDRTLLAWHDNFMAGWDGFVTAFGERFCRMWKYYLLACAGSFRARKMQLWQIVLSPEGVPGGYHTVR